MCGPEHTPQAGNGPTLAFGPAVHSLSGMNPVALVTGGAVRVGRAISLGLARQGWDLVVNYRSSAGPADEVRQEIEAMGRRCVLARGDLGVPDEVESVAGAVREEFGRLDLLVNSAANFHSTSLLDIDAEEWDRVMDVNLRGPHLLTRACADLLQSAEGSVVNIADHMGMQPWVRYAHHSISKAGLIHLTRIQARALGPEVRVNAVAPGLVLPPDDMDPERLQAEVDATLVKRVGTPDDVVQAVLYLAGASVVTGQLLVVDGGGTLLDHPD